MSKRIELTGKRFSRLIVIKKAHNTRYSHYWTVRCDCGAVKVVDGKALRSGRTKSCGCLLREVTLRQAVRRRIRPYEGLYNLFVRAAGIVNKGLSITYDDFVEFTKIGECHYCGHPITWCEYNARGARYSLDRKDSALGYTKENCVVCCTDCNFAKGARYSHDEWSVMAKALRAYRRSL